MLVTDPTSALVLVVIVGWVGGLIWWGLRRRAQATRVMKSPLYAGGGPQRPPGSAIEIEDAGQVPVRELLGGLRVRDSDELAGVEPEEVAHALGLEYFWGGGTRPLTGGATYPTVMYGERNGHEALIQWGLAGTSFFPRLRLQQQRHVTAVRVKAPGFELGARDGRIDAPADAPGEVRGVVEALNPSPDVWHDLRIVGGAEGIIVSRGSANDYLGGWIYDLWFLERLAAELGAPALPAVGVDEDWEVPTAWASGRPSCGAAELLEGLRGARPASRSFQDSAANRTSRTSRTAKPASEGRCRLR